MIPNTNMIFGNIFDDAHITTPRIFAFGKNCLNRFISANSAHDYDVIILLLTTTLTNLGNDLGSVDTSLNLQKGKTMNNDDLMALFSSTMSDEEPFIAKALGGRLQAFFLEFYPHGISEYTKATKLKMPVLTNRVNVAATTHAVALGSPLTATLQDFKASWETNRNTQEAQKGTVKTNRTDRSANRVLVELALLTAIHIAGKAFPGDVAQAGAFFDFNLLFGQTNHTHDLHEGIIPIEGKIVLSNRLLTDNASIVAGNTSTNADYLIYLSATEDGEPTADAVTINAAHAKALKPSALGDLSFPFLIIKSTSAVNVGAYSVEIIG